MSGITLRILKKEDSADLLRWRNDSETRKNSFSEEEIPLEKHKAWFEKTLKNPNRIVFIGLNDAHEKIGMVRFDQEESLSSAEINIAIAPEARGKGYGTELLTKSCEAFFNSHPSAIIIAKIKKFNVASIKAFTKAGFEMKEEHEEVLTMHMEHRL